MNIITGMHRSGTSAIARIFHEAGADMGDTSTFYRPDIWNPDGYFEQPDIHAVNMPLIHGPWGRLAYFRLPAEETISKRAEKIHGRIAATTKKYADKLVKETRFCLTLNAWRAHGANIQKILICIREPIETARSITKRNKIPERFALHLWHEHYRRLLAQVADARIWLVHYNHLLADSLRLNEIQGALHFMDLDATRENADKIWAAVIKPSMNHQKSTTTFYPLKIEALWRDLTEIHRKQRNDITEHIHEPSRT